MEVDDYVDRGKSEEVIRLIIPLQCIRNIKGELEYEPEADKNHNFIHYLHPIKQLIVHWHHGQVIAKKNCGENISQKNLKDDIFDQENDHESQNESSDEEETRVVKAHRFEIVNIGVNRVALSFGFWLA